MELDRLAPGPLVVLGDLDADDAERIAYARGDAETRFLVRFFSDLREYEARGLRVAAAWWPELDESVAAVVVFHAREREVTELRLASAAHAFPRAQEIFVVGHNKLGTGNIHKNIGKHFDEADKLASARHSALVRFAKPKDDGLPNTEAGWWQSWQLPLDGASHTIWDLPGVFARGSLDRGTAMLLECAPDHRGDRVLDLGAGSGVISIARGLRSPTAQLTLVEHDILAVASARRNIDALGLSERAEVIFGDIDALPNDRYDSVVTNPPFHAGSQVTTDTTKGWFGRMKSLLRPGGDLTLVANRHLPYADALDAAFKQVRVVKEDSKFRVWNARQPR